MSLRDDDDAQRLRAHALEAELRERDAELARTEEELARHRRPPEDARHRLRNG